MGGIVGEMGGYFRFTLGPKTKNPAGAGFESG